MGPLNLLGHTFWYKENQLLIVVTIYCWDFKNREEWVPNYDFREEGYCLNNLYLFMSIWIISVTLVISGFLIRKKFHVRLVSIFLVLFIIGQVLGYGLGVNIFKAVIPYGDSGIIYQVIPSTAFPLVFTFIIVMLIDYFTSRS